MDTDANLRAWLETIDGSQPAIVIPHIQTEHDTTLRYRVTARRDGPDGRTVVGQGGTVNLTGGVPAALGRVSLNYGPEDSCGIELTVYGVGAFSQAFHFECPDPPPPASHAK
ncbi:curli-like amyloid fiber formation chaperone CsgH [Castellaniella sp. GW247-6E4]|uniref:curli-like amyloid fiber formation chaperone CsgH n=1 Tax=Castellaniella sp. GW247-6E4 TaxID=3140380 RepID=UPI003315E3E1